MKRIVFFYYAVAVVLLSGCALTASERQGIIDAASQNASIAAARQAYDLVYAEEMKHGKTAEEAKEAATKAASVAEKAAGSVAGVIADKATKDAEDAKGSKAGGIISSIIIAVLGIAGSILSTAKKAA